METLTVLKLHCERCEQAVRLPSWLDAPPAAILGFFRESEQCAQAELIREFDFDLSVDVVGQEGQSQHLEEHLKYWMSEGCQERYAVRSFRMHLRPYLKEAACADASGAAGRLLDVIVRTDEADCLRENLETFFSSLRETN